MRRFVLVSGLALAACGDPTDPGSINRIRTVLFYREDTGENHLLNSDGSGARVLPVAGANLVPVGLSSSGDEVALLRGRTLVVSAIANPGALDTVLDPVPAQMSLVAFSPDDRYIALVQYLPEPRLLIVDRAGHVDTLRTGDRVPSLPPAFSPDGTRVALVSVTDLSTQITIITLNTNRAPTERAGFSPFVYRLVFGWPRWTDRGLLLGTVRPGGDFDTVAVLAVDPEQPSNHADVILRLVGPPLAYDAGSSYALSAGGDAVVLAAVPLLRGGRDLFYGTAQGGSLVRLLTDPGARPAFPLLLP